MSCKIQNLTAAACAAFYGAWIWSWHSFGVSNAFSLYSAAPEYAFALPLIAGAALIAFGEARQRRALLFCGHLFCVAIFLAAQISCWLAAIRSTGVPVYLAMCCFYSLFALDAAHKPKPSVVK